MLQQYMFSGQKYKVWGPDEDQQPQFIHQSDQMWCVCVCVSVFECVLKRCDEAKEQEVSVCVCVFICVKVWGRSKTSVGLMGQEGTGGGHREDGWGWGGRGGGGSLSS